MSGILQPYIEIFLKSFYVEECSEIETFAKLNKIPVVDVMTGNFLKFLLSLTKPKIGLEIGCGIGVSMDYILQVPTIEKYVALDTNRQRLDMCKKRHKDKKNEYHNIDGESFLKNTDEKFDFIFVDSIKSKYIILWQYIKKHLNKNSLIIFDDVLLYGILGLDLSLIPDKYSNLYEELNEFILEIKYDKLYQSFILPIGNGLLLIENVN
jgi:predicted O-methyltransferase YrrM